MRNSSLLMLLMCALSAPAQDKPVTVQGLVTNALTGEPLLRAHVALRPMMNRSQSNEKRYGALTTVDGKFTITAIAPGTYSVAVDKTGFVASTMGTTLNLQAGDTKDDIKLKLLPCGTIVGRVLTAEGGPVENATVTIDNMPSNTTTDEQGQFRIGGLQAGKYRVRASRQDIGFPPEIRTDGTKEVNYAATYYPSALLPASATRVEVRAGSETSGIDIRLVSTPIVRISGTVAGLPSGNQFARVELRKGRSGGNSANVKADGTFEMWKVEPGKYTVMASFSNASGIGMQSPPVEIEVADRNVDRIALTLLPPIDLSGRMQFEDEKARPQQPGQQGPQRVMQSVQQDRPAAQRVMFNSIDGYSSQNSAVSADDSFHVIGLSPARYRVMISWGPACVKSLRIGNTQVEGNILDLRQGAAGDSVTVVVSSVTGTITGTVTDDQGPAPTAMIALLPDDPDAGPQVRYIGAKPDGTYTMAGIAPGKYRIAAVDEANRNAMMRGGNVEDFVDVTEAIEVSGADPVKKDLKVRK